MPDQAADLEGKLRERELEVERLRTALAKHNVDQSAVAGAEKVRRGSGCLCRARAAHAPWGASSHCFRSWND